MVISNRRTRAKRSARIAGQCSKAASERQSWERAPAARKAYAFDLLKRDERIVISAPSLIQ
jgi:hypothetical protein